ncbi:MAG: hypothetical protein ACR2G0_09180 [Chthoniobacterales bacterium]
MKTLFFLFFTITFSVMTIQAEPAGSGTASTKRAIFSQYCFWTGEMKLGQVDGVVRTEAGFFKGHEVTLVDYDPQRITLEKLAQAAKSAGVADRIHLPSGSTSASSSVGGVRVGAPIDGSYRAAPSSDQKKQLEGTPYARLKLTPEQATKVNAFARSNPDKAAEWLAPAQRANLASAR